METEMGAGINMMVDFAVDFGDTHTYICGKSYPKGHFANAALNIGKEELTQLLIVTAPIFHALQDVIMDGYSTERFERGRAAVLELKELLSRIAPFSLLDLEAEQERLDYLLSDDAEQFLQEYWELLQRKDSEGELMKKEFSEEETDIVNRGQALLQTFVDLLNFYRYIPHDFSNFSVAIINFENQYLRSLEKRNENTFAEACNDYFSYPFLPILLRAFQIVPAIAGFSLCANTRQEYIVIPQPGKENRKVIARRLRFFRIMDFLVTDFFEGLHAGHAPMRCAVCKRFFLTTDGRAQKYCDGYAPDDPKHRTCRQVGNRMGREAREKSSDHPAKSVYRRRCNTIDHHLRDGKISEVFSTAAKKVAKEKLDMATKNNVYFTTQYEQEMTQEAIYAEAEHRTGKEREKQCTATVN